MVLLIFTNKRSFIEVSSNPTREASLFIPQICLWLRTQSDIKPSNILLCRNGQVKLCDFGVSGESGTKGDANTFIGTSYYMAPERITGQSYTITSDVWSLGVTLLEVAQHRFPFPADGTEMQPKANVIDLLTYIVRQAIPKLKDEPDNNIRWSDSFKYFIECWYVHWFFNLPT